MFGDYYTNTLLSASPSTNMIGNQIERFQLEPQKNIGAALVIVLTLVLTVLHGLLPDPDSTREQRGDAMTVLDRPRPKSPRGCADVCRRGATRGASRTSSPRHVGVPDLGAGCRS